jgi:putative hydroxymethylpyrimidine transporter CytX
MKLDDSGPLSLSLVWFGAAVSLAEISTGALLAGTPPTQGMAANLAGHLVGAAFLFAAAWISWKRGRSAIAVCDASFGPAGPRLFGILNVVQLIGWTAVMIVVGARSMDAVASQAFGFHAELLWRLVIGLLVVALALAGFGKTGAAGLISIVALAGLCIVLSIAVFLPGFLPGLAPHAAATALPERLGFGSALELAVIMPLSWLPLIGDYVKGAKSGWRSCLSAALAYSLASVWMYSLGLFSARLRGSADPVGLLSGVWALPALAVVLLATVTTAFLDLRSAGFSLTAAFPKAGMKLGILGCGILGLALALVAPVERYESFLTFIGSVFAPLYAVIFADALVRGIAARIAPRAPSFSFACAFTCWAGGVALYLVISPRPGIFGASIPVMAAVSIAYALLVIGGSTWKTFRAIKAS